MKMEFIPDSDSRDWGTFTVEHASISTEIHCTKKMAVAYMHKIVENPKGSIEAIEHFYRWLDKVEVNTDVKKT